MSLILENQKLLFLHIEKNAGTSITNWLDEYAELHQDKTYLVHHRHVEWSKIPKQYCDYWTFCVIRNPWSRLVSRYKYDMAYYKEKYVLGEGTYFLKVYEELQKGFKHWLTNNVYITSNIDYKIKWQPQSKVIKGCSSINILRYENIDQDFQLVQNKLKWYKNLPKTNSTSPCNYRDYYTQELKSLVAEKYYEDIKKFNYTF